MRQALKPSSLVRLRKSLVDSPLQAPRTLLGHIHDADNLFLGPIECLEDGTSNEEALTTVDLNGGIAAGRIMEDADAEEVTL